MNKCCRVFRQTNDENNENENSGKKATFKTEKYTRTNIRKLCDCVRRI